MKESCIVYSLRRADESGVRQHAELQMKQLGITYIEAVPQSMYDSWEFWGCDNIPEDLPEYLKAYNNSPLNYIGFGLSAIEAIKLYQAISDMGIYVKYTNLNEYQKKMLDEVNFDYSSINNIVGKKFFYNKDLIECFESAESILDNCSTCYFNDKCEFLFTMPGCLNCYKDGNYVNYKKVEK